MNKDLSKTKTDIKEWLIIQRIRMLNFIKEHKYISVGIFAFLFAALVGFIVYAQDESDTIVTTAGAERIVLDGEDVRKAESFSEVVYDLKYKIDLADEQDGEQKKTVIIKASIPSEIDAEWLIYEEANANFYRNEETGGLIVEIYDVVTGVENSLKLHLYLKNIAPETSFAPSFKVYDKKYENSENIDESNHSKEFSPEEIIIQSKKIKLSSKIIEGQAYKSNEFNGRYAPFGIILGFEKGEYESMRGLYFDPKQVINLSAHQINSNDEGEEYFELDKVENYGVYTKSVKGLDMEGISNVFNSGKILEIKKIENDSSSEEEVVSGEENLENEEEADNEENISELDQSYLYEMDINEIKSDGNLYINEIGEEKFITLGTYYIVLNSERQEDNEENIEVILTSYNDNYEEESSAVVENVFYQEGTQNYSFTLNKQTGIEITPISDDEYLTYGDEVILSSVYKYGSSWDDNLEKLYIKVDLHDNNEIPFELINYSEEELFYVSDEYKEKTKIVSYKLLESNEEIKEGLFSLVDIDKIEYLIFEVKDIIPGADIEIRVKGKISSKYNLKLATLKSGIIDENYEYVKEDGLLKKLSFNITPFRSATVVYANNKNQDIRISEETSEITLSIFPSVELPALKVQSSLLESPKVDVYIHVILHEGMKYVENMQYVLPQVSGNKLTYILESQVINEKMGPIDVDINYDPTVVKNNTEMKVDVIIEAVSSDNEQRYDTTPEKKRTTTRIITYNSVASIVGSISFNKNSISKEESFEVISKVSNKSNNDISLGIVTLLPYNDNMSSSEISYNGNYSFVIPKNSLCTNALPSDIKSSTKLLLVEWKDCNEFDNEEITAIRTNSKLSNEEYSVQNIVISTIDNKADDKYEFNSYMIINDTDVQKIGAKTVSVFSKKITGMVWEDLDSDGKMDEDEEHVPDIMLKLYDSSGKLVDETTSNSKGEYTFTDVQEGNYYIIAEFNKDKYSATIKSISEDLTKTSSFEQLADELVGKAITGNIEINENIKIKSNVNLGLSLRQLYKVSMKKYISKIEITNSLGITNTKLYDKGTSFVKLDVKDINNLKIKVVYLIEIENTGYFPGYIREIRDYIPDGMSFNKNYEENKQWVEVGGSDKYIINRSLSNTLIWKKKEYLTIAFDISRKEAGSFKNYVEILDEDLEIFSINKNDIIKGGK